MKLLRSTSSISKFEERQSWANNHWWFMNSLTGLISLSQGYDNSLKLSPERHCTEGLWFCVHGLRKGPHCSSLGNLSWDATVKWQNIADLCSLLLHAQDIIPGKFSMPADFNVYYDIFSLVCFWRRGAESAGFTEVSTACCRQVFSLTPYCGVGGAAGLSLKKVSGCILHCRGGGTGVRKSLKFQELLYPVFI